MRAACGAARIERCSALSVSLTVRCVLRTAYCRCRCRCRGTERHGILSIRAAACGAARRGSRWERGGPAVIGWSAAAASGEGETTQELNTGRRCSLTSLQDLPARLGFMNRYLRPLAADALAFLFLSISPKRAATKTDKLCYLRALPPPSWKTKRARTGAAWRCDINDVDHLAALNYVISLCAHKDVACLSLASRCFYPVICFSLLLLFLLHYLFSGMCS